MTECFTDYHRGIFYLFSDTLVDQLESMPGQPWNKSPPLPFKSREHFMSLLQEQAKAMIKQYATEDCMHRAKVCLVQYHL